MPSFRFHPKCELLQISHLAYSDDLILLSRGDSASMKVLLDSLDMFSAASGLEVNPSKSSYYLAGVHEVDRSYLSSRTGTCPFRYLGIPISSGKLTVAQYTPLA